MLTQLTPQQIEAHWDELKEGIRSSLPPTARSDDEGMLTVYTGLMSDALQGWVLIDDTSKEIVGVLTTAVLTEFGSGAKFLLIYSLYGHQAILSQTWQSMLVDLSLFAESKKCLKIVAYTIHKGLFSMVQKRLPDAEEQHCIIIPVHAGG